MEELKFLKEEIQGLKTMQNEHIYGADNNLSIGNVMDTSVRNFKPQRYQQSEPRELALEHENQELRKQVAAREEQLAEQQE
jgi:hypothetical protein